MSRKATAHLPNVGIIEERRFKAQRQFCRTSNRGYPSIRLADEARYFLRAGGVAGTSSISRKLICAERACS